MLPAGSFFSSQLFICTLIEAHFSHLVVLLLASSWLQHPMQELNSRKFLSPLMVLTFMKFLSPLMVLTFMKFLSPLMVLTFMKFLSPLMVLTFMKFSTRCYYHTADLFAMGTSFQDVNKQVKYFNYEHSSCSILHMDTHVTVFLFIAMQTGYL